MTFLFLSFCSENNSMISVASISFCRKKKCDCSPREGRGGGGGPRGGTGGGLGGDASQLSSGGRGGTDLEGLYCYSHFVLA